MADTERPNVLKPLDECGTGPDNTPDELSAAKAMLSRRSRVLNEMQNQLETHLSAVGCHDLNTAKSEFERLRDIEKAHSAQLSANQSLTAQIDEMKAHEAATARSVWIARALEKADVFEEHQAMAARIIAEDVQYDPETRQANHKNGMGLSDFAQQLRAELPGTWVRSRGLSIPETKGATYVARNVPTVNLLDPKDVKENFDYVAMGRYIAK